MGELTSRKLRPNSLSSKRNIIRSMENKLSKISKSFKSKVATDDESDRHSVAVGATEVLIYQLVVG
jgi:hypothetical protein